MNQEPVAILAIYEDLRRHPSYKRLSAGTRNAMVLALYDHSAVPGVRDHEWLRRRWRDVYSPVPSKKQ